MSNCKASFKRIDHFKVHAEQCTLIEDDLVQFIPSFTATDEPNTKELPPVATQFLEESVFVVVPQMHHDKLQATEVVPDSFPEPLLFTPNLPETPIQQKIGWKSYKETQQKSANLENIIPSLSSPVKRSVFKILVNNNSKTVDVVLTYTNASSIYEAKVCQAFLGELKELNRLKRYRTFNLQLNKVFSEQLEDEGFLI